jgi:hypothetical protein
MTELERSLRALDVDWPSTPAVQLELVPRRRRRTVAALAVVAAAAAAFAVPQSRSAILDFFHLGGVTVVRVETLPPAQERPLSAGLGAILDDAGAVKILGTAFVPRQHGTLHERDGFVSTVLRGPVLLSEFGSAYLIKKFAAGAVEWVEVAPGVQGLWIAGASHVVLFPGTSARLAGAVLVWERGGVTFRLEGAGLRKKEALRLAHELLGTDPG